MWCRSLVHPIMEKAFADFKRRDAVGGVATVFNHSLSAVEFCCYNSGDNFAPGVPSVAYMKQKCDPGETCLLKAGTDAVLVFVGDKKASRGRVQKGSKWRWDGPGFFRVP